MLFTATMVEKTMKIGDLVSWPDIGVIVAEDTDEFTEEKMYKVFFWDGDIEWFYDGFLESA